MTKKSVSRAVRAASGTVVGLTLALAGGLGGAPGTASAAAVDPKDLGAVAALGPSWEERVAWGLLEGSMDNEEEAVRLTSGATAEVSLRYLVEALRAGATDRAAMLVHLVSVNGPSAAARAEASEAYADLLVAKPADERRVAHRKR